MEKDIKEQINIINAKEDIKKLDLLYRKILDTDFSNEKSISLKEDIASQIDRKIVELMKEYHISNEEYSELIFENRDYKKIEKRTQQMAEDRYNMIWENCSSKEIVDILRNSYSYTDEEIIEEFVDEEVREEIENYLLELTEREEAPKNVMLDNGYTFVFENGYYFSKMKEICEYSQDFARIPNGKEFAIITNAEVTKEAFLVKCDHNIEIVFNFLNQNSNEMETYKTNVFNMNKINSKEELIEKMKENLEKFEKEYNKLEQDEENMEVE